MIEPDLTDFPDLSTDLTTDFDTCLSESDLPGSVSDFPWSSSVVDLPNGDNGCEDIPTNTVNDCEDEEDDVSELTADDTSLTSYLDVVATVISLGFYLSDVASDIWMSYMHYSRGDVHWFIYTVVVILVSSMIVSIVSLSWYLRRNKEHKMSRRRWAVISVFLVLQIAPVLRYVIKIFHLQGARASDVCLSVYIRM